MNKSLLFSKDNIFLNVIANNQNEAFKFIANKFTTLNFSDNEKKCLKGLHHREKESSTGFVNGFAIPHAKIKQIISPGLILVTFANPVEWNSMDGKPIKIAFALAIPDKKSNDNHLKMLSTIATALVSEEFQKTMLEVKTLDEMYNVVSEIIK